MQLVILCVVVVICCAQNAAALEACFAEERCSLSEKSGWRQNEWVPTSFFKNSWLAFTIFTGILGSCKKSWSCLFIARMCLSIIQPWQYLCLEQQKQVNKVCALTTDTPLRFLKASSGETCSLLQMHEENRKPNAVHLPREFHLFTQTSGSSHLQRYTSDNGQQNKQPVFKENNCQ